VPRQPEPQATFAGIDCTMAGIDSVALISSRFRAVDVEEDSADKPRVSALVLVANVRNVARPRVNTRIPTLALLSLFSRNGWSHQPVHFP